MSDVVEAREEVARRLAGIGVFDWDLLTGSLTWDDRLLELFGYDRESFGGTIEAFNARVHPQDLPRVARALQEAIDTCGEYEAEYRVLLPGDGIRWVGARGRAVPGEAGEAVRLLGAAYDTTAHREAQSRVVEVLESMPAAFFSLDEEWRFTYVNGEAERLLRRPAAELLGRVVWDTFPAVNGSVFEERYRAAMRTRRPTTFDAHYPHPLNAWYEVRVWPTPRGLSVYFMEITQRRAAQELAERAARRAALLARVTSELTSTLDPEEGVTRLGPLLVPELADWCVITLAAEDDGQGDWRRRLRDVTSWHAEPRKRPLLQRYAQVRMLALTDESYVARALRTGRPVTVTRDATSAVGGVLASGEARDLLAELAPASAACFPLLGRGRTVGLISLFNGPGRPPMSAEDVQTVEELAGRAGLALDSARLYAQQRQVAEELQRSLLTEPPEPDHVQIVVRYEAAAQAAQVGGDWYDAFLQHDGATVLVIGDVVGHDTAAAAAMGQVRGLLRGIAVHSGGGPAEVLDGVDRVMQTLQLNTTATAVVARIEQTDDDRRRGISRLRWSNAGHPPPLLINPDGTVTVLAEPAPDLLLGVVPGSARTESEVALDRGATVLLYTDGLVERRTQPLDEGVRLLRESLADLTDRRLDELADAVLDRLLPAHREDDVALVAIRLHPQSRPRPPEAGPNRVPPDVPSAPAVDPGAG